MQGAFWGMLVAQIWGILKFILDFVYPSPPCDNEDMRPSFIKDWHVYYHTFSQIILAFLIAAIVSVATDKVPEEQVGLIGLDFRHL